MGNGESIAKQETAYRKWAQKKTPQGWLAERRKCW
jgi:hypothetical protein